MMKTQYYWLKIKNIFNKYTKKSYFLTKYRIRAQNRMRPCERDDGEKVSLLLYFLIDSLLLLANAVSRVGRQIRFKISNLV